MKKILSSFCLFTIVAICMAQEITTYSVYDTNQSGDISVSDVTEVVDNVKKNVAAASTQQYVTADMLTSLFATILDKFKTLENRMSTMEAKVGIETPDDPKQTASFEIARKNLKVGDTFTQTVTSNSDGIVTYISSNPTVASIDASSGLVTAIANGEAIITAVIAATSTYNALAASYTVRIEDANILNGHEYVDLGLSVKWAKTNIGAENIYDSGDYFAWGETSGYNDGKENFVESTYKYYKSSTGTDADGFVVTTTSGFTKYVQSSDALEYGYDGFHDDKTTLESSDDAATYIWGDSWKIPTQAQWDELSTKCTWAWATLNGINGYKVTATNGNYIFLPANGFSIFTGRYGDGSGCYWSSSLYSNSSIAYSMHFGSNNQNASFIQQRHYGYGVRAVCP